MDIEYTIGKPWENHGKMMVFHEILWDLPLVTTNIAVEIAMYGNESYDRLMTFWVPST